jgi:hypothetical protein
MVIIFKGQSLTMPPSLFKMTMKAHAAKSMEI